MHVLNIINVREVVKREARYWGGDGPSGHSEDNNTSTWGETAGVGEARTRGSETTDTGGRGEGLRRAKVTRSLRYDGE